MPKEHYKWPSGIDRGILDHEISLGTKNSAGKMIPIKVIVSAVLWGFLNMYIIQSLMIPANVFLAVAYTIWAIAIGIFLFRLTKTREMAVRQAMAYVTYAPKANRTVMTRLSSKPNGFYNLVGIRKVHDDGLIEYTDNTFGRAMLVVGSASLLLFDADRDAILDSVDSFWRKMPTDVEMIQITTKEPQRIAYQVDAMNKRMKYLSVDSEDLRGLLTENFERMREVGMKFLSTHQYVVLKSEFVDSIDNVMSLMMSEVEFSGRVFQSFTPLDTSDSVIKMLKPLYEGRQGFDVMNARLRRSNTAMSSQQRSVRKVVNGKIVPKAKVAAQPASTGASKVA